MPQSSISESAPSKELITYYNLLTGKPPETPQEFTPETSSVKAGLGRTLNYEETRWDDDLIKLVTLFKKATYDDLIKREGAWSTLKTTGPVTSLKFKTRGAYLPDITTRISAEGKDINYVRSELHIIYGIMKDFEKYLERQTISETEKAKDILFEFFNQQYGSDDVKYRFVKRLYNEELGINTPFDSRINMNSIWQKDSVSKKDKYTIKGITEGHTDYFKLLIYTPKEIQFPTEQTTNMVRVGKKTPAYRLEAVVNKHISDLTPIYHEVCKNMC